MSRTRGVGALVAVALTGVAGPATAEFTSATFGPTGALTADGRVAEVSLRVACTDGRVGFSVTLTQGSVSGVRRGADRCGQVPDLMIVISAATGDTVENCRFHPIEPCERVEAFIPGPADACGHVIFQNPGGGEQSYRWCDEVLLRA